MKDRPFMTVKPDIDNLEKLVKDAMKGIIYRDDSLVVGVHKLKQYAEPPGVSGSGFSRWRKNWV